MAQPIAFHAPVKAATTNSERLRNAPAEHAEALLSGYELLQLLHDRGVLNLLRGLVAGGDALVGTIAAAVDTPESLRAIRSFVVMTKLFAGISPDVMSSLAGTVSAAARREKTHKAPGLLHLLWRLRNQDSRHAVSIALDLLEGLGKEL